jgi:hypothetical protein
MLDYIVKETQVNNYLTNVVFRIPASLSIQAIKPK